MKVADFMIIHELPLWMVDVLERLIVLDFEAVVADDVDDSSIEPHASMWIRPRDFATLQPFFNQLDIAVAIAI